MSNFFATASGLKNFFNFQILRSVDWVLFLALVFLVVAGLLTMNSFVGENYFFDKQLVWAILAVTVFFVASFIDWSFLRRTEVVISVFILSVFFLSSLFIIGSVFKGAQSWLNVGLFTIQPSDPAKLALILLLAKYFSRRHIEIAYIKHILISGFYTLILFVLIFLQPDFGSAIIVGLIWFGMILVSGISKKHLLLVLGAGILALAMLWFFVFEDYQKQRVLTFLNPLTDIHGAGYNAYQSTIAVGSGQFFGKGVGFGTQSRLQYLPEYETDFIFAAFAEEWGFVGVLILLFLFGLVGLRIIQNSVLGATNFEILFGVGVLIMIGGHIAIHIGMNMGLLPVTGIPLPFVSYGGSHLITEFLSLGILMGQRTYRRRVHRDDVDQEFVPL